MRYPFGDKQLLKRLKIAIKIEKNSTGRMHFATVNKAIVEKILNSSVNPPLKHIKV